MKIDNDTFLKDISDTIYLEQKNIVTLWKIKIDETLRMYVYMLYRSQTYMNFCIWLNFAKSNIRTVMKGPTPLFSWKYLLIYEARRLLTSCLLLISWCQGRRRVRCFRVHVYQNIASKTNNIGRMSVFQNHHKIWEKPGCFFGGSNA